MTVEEIIDRINFYLDYNSWTLYKLANEADIPYSSLKNIIYRKTFPTIQTLESICNGFNITLDQFFDNKSSSPSGIVLSEDEHQIIKIYRKLPTNDKKILKTYLKGLARITD